MKLVEQTSKSEQEELFISIIQLTETEKQEYPAHVRRMFIEYCEAYQRHKDLNKFIDTSEIFEDLDTEMKFLRVEQRAHMYNYRNVLCKIIKKELRPSEFGKVVSSISDTIKK